MWFYCAARVEDHCFGTTCVQPHPVTSHTPSHSHPHPPCPSGAGGFFPPRRKAEETPGTEVADVIFLVCGISFSFCKTNTTKVLEEPENNHSCSRFASVLAQQPGQPRRLNAFVPTGTFFSPRPPATPTPHKDRMSHFQPL